MFKGFYKTGIPITNTVTNGQQQGFPSTTFGQVGGNGAIPTTGLVAWFNPSVNITLNGSTVSQWQDTTGAYTLSQATGSKQPTYFSGVTQYNNNPYLFFNASGLQSLVSAAINLGVGTNSVWSIFSVYQLTGWNGSTALGLGYGYTGTTVPGLYFLDRALVSEGNAPAYADAVTSYVPTAGTQTTQLCILGLEINRGVATLYTHLNGGYRTSSTTISSTLTNYNGGNMFLGSDSYDSLYVNMNQLDMLFYNSSLSLSDYNNLYNYFKTFYKGIP